MMPDDDVETHLVMSKWAVRTLLHETSYVPKMWSGWRAESIRPDQTAISSVTPTA